jgi:hypothetical protein
MVSNLGMTRFFLAACLMCWCGIAAGQVSGEFYLEKPVYARGEPIFVYFQAVNNGPTTERLYSADPNSPFCSAFQTVISTDPPRSSRACGGGISCLSSSVELLPGERHVERVLLNLQHKLDAPGMYSVQVMRRAHNSLNGDRLEVHATLDFRVDRHVAQSAVFQPWLDQLRSTDQLKRIEAARALASVAPRSLENTLLTFGDDPLLRQFAPLAFHRLNTPRSMAAMAELLQKTNPGSFEYWQASAYLSHDPCADF